MPGVISDEDRPGAPNRAAGDVNGQKPAVGHPGQAGQGGHDGTEKAVNLPRNTAAPPRRAKRARASSILVWRLRSRGSSKIRTP